jgi:RNA polymerase sigma-70 factor, ECF subfamily
MPSFPELPMPEVLLSPEESATATAVYADWSDLVARIRSGQTDGMEELYRLFSRGIRFYLVRQLGIDDVDDTVHDTFVSIVQAIQRDELREPERLMGFVRSVVRKQVEDHINQAVRRIVVSSEPRRDDPEEAIAFHRRTGLIDQVLATLSNRDLAILSEFYVQERSQDEICMELGLTETQFRLLKSGAKARFVELYSGGIARDASFPLDVKRILPVIAHAVGVFGDEQKASHWLATPLPLFGDRSPSQLLEGREGTELVEQVLTRIEHNIPS